MSISDLIAELQRYPSYLQVRVNIDSFEVEDEAGWHVIMGPGEAIAARCVIYEGNHVVIESI